MFKRLLLKLSFQIRHNPARFLFNDAILKKIDLYEEGEMTIFRRSWKGPVWDVGASVGKYATVMAEANPNQTVYCFEPNLNSLYYLGYRTAKKPNVVIVPLAVTWNGALMKGNYNPDFGSEPTGPLVPTLSANEAVAKFGKPAFVKLDIEGGEYDLLREEPEGLRGAHLLVEWHPVNGRLDIPVLKHWKAVRVSPHHLFYEPV